MIKVKVQENLISRPIIEMYEMLYWVIDNFPQELDSKRWTYGRGSVDIYGRRVRGILMNGPWEIEYFEFRDEKDAMLFTLRWL